MDDDDTRANAACACGRVPLRLHAAPLFTIACHCGACRKRSGSPFGTGVNFPRAAAGALPSSATEYARPTDAGGTFRNFFCGTCGSPVYWLIDEHPEVIGVALGALDRAPEGVEVHSLWEAGKLPWVDLAHAAQHHPAGYPEA